MNPDDDPGWCVRLVLIETVSCELSRRESFVNYRIDDAIPRFPALEGYFRGHPTHPG